MSRSWNESLFHDDHAGFDRPSRSRPRTKDRPDYSDLPLARVVTIDRGRYRCLVDEPVKRTRKKRSQGSAGNRLVTAAKARALGRQSVIVGDLVRLDADVSGRPGTMARIAEVLDRTTVLRRTADDTDPHERPIVANADQLVVVVALADPPPRLGMIDRILVAGYDAGLTPLLCLTKSDLANPDEVLLAYQPLGVTTYVLAPLWLNLSTAERSQENPDDPVDPIDPSWRQTTEQSLAQLRQQLADRVSVFVGHSGVGKSTLVNALIPEANRLTGAVNDVTGRGRHTSTTVVALELPDPGGWVIDTPGVRSFGLSHVTPDRVLAAFPDLALICQDCPRGCTHRANAPDCALDQAVRDGRLTAARLASFRRLQLAE